MEFTLNCLILVVAVLGFITCLSHEPHCSKYHYEEQTLERMIRAEIKFEDLRKSVDESLSDAKQERDALISKIEELQNNIDGLTKEKNMQEIHWSDWNAWSAWTHCTGPCTNGYSKREQNRQRTRTCPNNPAYTKVECPGESVENEQRPCNMVESYGCLNEKNVNSSDGVMYGLAYNFYDELAQSTCTAAVTSSSYVAAIRRNCGAVGTEECSTLCSRLGYKCFDALHVHRSFTTLQPNDKSHSDEGKRGLYLYRYFSCTFGSYGCGPNYCCCQWR